MDSAAPRHPPTPLSNAGVAPAEGASAHRASARPPLPVLSRIEREAASRFLHMPEALLRRIVGPPVRSPEEYVLDLQSQALLWLIRMTGEPAMHDPDLGKA